VIFRVAIILAMARKVSKQVGLFEPKRAKRRGARGRDACQPHVAREAHHRDHPVHVTMRRVAMGPSFRAQRVCAAIRGVIGSAKRNGVRVLHYSVQENHLHLMVEGRDSADLSNQMRTLFSRIAFAVNAIARRHGRLFRDRHHRHELTTPSEVRNALVYILFNDRKHHAVRGKAPPSLDPCSSAWWFEAWSPSDRPPERNLRDGPEAPTSTPGTWLARWGWHRGDTEKLLRFSESPLAAPPRAR
jgi:REP element-mobilizing transposase RayT